MHNSIILPGAPDFSRYLEDRINDAGIEVYVSAPKRQFIPAPAKTGELTRGIKDIWEITWTQGSFGLYEATIKELDGSMAKIIKYEGFMPGYSRTSFSGKSPQPLLEGLILYGQATAEFPKVLLYATIPDLIRSPAEMDRDDHYENIIFP